MASSYDYVATKLTAKFNKNNVKAAAREFQNKHGLKGHGEGGKQPYRFGNFANTDVGTPDQQVRWLIDTGTRNWDDTVEKLQDLIRDNLSDTGRQIPMQFTIKQGTAPKAKAEWIEKTEPNGDPYYDVTLICRKEPL
jgi:peptidoglycan hydrolase-like protein with peptidoglycan-binding domain